MDWYDESGESVPGLIATDKSVQADSMIAIGMTAGWPSSGLHAPDGLLFDGQVRRSRQSSGA